MRRNDRMARRQNLEKREEEKANRLFKLICAALLLLALLMIVGYALAS
ncbi:MAG TPA: hypothetical protein H9752_08310 [Candidatus Phocaeicola excrementigallinarum]|nr:hypothetical protein [Candidatus Phocaeicola excrementigallinarum]